MNTSFVYRRTQKGTVIMAAVVTSALVMTAVWVLVVRATATPSAWLAGAFALLFLVAVLFSSLTVEVTPSEVRWHFGPGFWRKRLDRAEIVSASPVRNRWWYGWGIRATPHGWLYNVSGLDAVEVVRRDGGKVRIGTDDPEGLARALKG